MTKQEKVRKVIARLSKLYPNARTALDYKTPWQLLVATILSARATDKLVNQVTPDLFKKFPDACSVASSAVDEVDKLIRRVNFHNNKAKSIFGAAKVVCLQYHGRVPETLAELDSLPGVARKTANVVLGDAFGKSEGIVVDTHVMRLSHLLGLSESNDPVKVEQDLMKIVPKKYWIRFAHYLILYGREYHPARLKSDLGLPISDCYVQ